MYEIISTLGHHAEGKFYEIVAIVNCYNRNAITIQRNGGRGLASRRGAGQTRLLYVGGRVGAIEAFDRKVLEKNAYSLTPSERCHSMTEVDKSEVRALLQDHRIDIPGDSVFWQASSVNVSPVEDAVKSELPKIIPAQYGRW